MALLAVTNQKAGVFLPGGQYNYTEQWRKDEILAAKIKKFLSVSERIFIKMMFFIDICNSVTF